MTVYQWMCVLGMDAFLEALRMFGGFNAYNTVCTFEDGQLVYVLHSSYPQGPEENGSGPEADAAVSSEAIPVWKFFHGDPELLETAVITGSIHGPGTVPRSAGRLGWDVCI